MARTSDVHHASVARARALTPAAFATCPIFTRLPPDSPKHLTPTGLHDALAADGAARVVSVSFSGHGFSPVVFEDLLFERRPYDPGVAYGQSKAANSLFAVEATRRWAAEGITANAVMPGGSPLTSSVTWTRPWWRR